MLSRIYWLVGFLILFIDIFVVSKWLERRKLMTVPGDAAMLLLTIKNILVSGNFFAGTQGVCIEGSLGDGESERSGSALSQ